MNMGEMWERKKGLTQLGRDICGQEAVLLAAGTQIPDKKSL